MLLGVAMGTSAASPGGETKYVSPVNFTALKKVNPDVYAWIDIPDTDISYPVVNRAGDDSFYLTRNVLGKKDKKGALFTESYNNLRFTDRVTVIYGHNTLDGSLFGTLQKDYSNAKFFKEHKKIMVYLPDGEFEYTVFAAVPYSNVHLLYYYDFTRPRVFNAFFKNLYSIRALEANIDRKVILNPDDDILILSTCLKGNSNKRYLVLAVKKRPVQNSLNEERVLP
jgi:sortase B